MRKTLWLLLLLTPLVYASKWDGIAAPEFQLRDQHAQLRRLSDFKGRWLVLYFYPKDDTPGCTIEARNFARDYAQFQKLNADVVGVSLDDVASHKAFATTSKLSFTLLADVDKQASKAYDVLGLAGLYSKRQTFVIDPAGVIVKHYDSVDPDNHAAQLLRDLSALQANTP